MGYFDKTKQGRIIARADRDVESLEEPLVWGVFWLVHCTSSIIYAFTRMSLLSWKLIVLILCVLPFFLIATNIFRIKGFQAYRFIRESLSGITAFLSEAIQGIRIIKSFARESSFAQKFRRINNTHKGKVVTHAKIWNTYFPIIGLFYGLSTVITIIVGGSQVIKGELSIGEISTVLLLLGMFFGPMEGLTYFYDMLLSSAAAAERIFLLLDTKQQIIDTQDAGDVGSLKGDVRFEQVSFSYNTTEQVLKDINLHAPPGSTTALVGPTGSGKSSILNLLIRFYNADQGSIKLDELDIHNISLLSLRKNIGIVLQDNFLFTDTVMANLKYGNPGISDEKVIRLARKLGTHKVIMKLSHGYKTKVKERGEGISQGERQLICLTRVFVADPQIVILDEATSAVDTKTELIIQNALSTLLKNRTTFIAAHRLSTIRNADTILVIENGKITESGSFSSLIRKKGSFKKLYDHYKR
jgi:ATP-binding cassette subfamily B protein